MQGGLNTTSNAGSQTTTQNPQSATSDPGLTSNQSNLQSSSVNLFDSNTGVSLSPTTLPSVTLSPTTSSSKSYVLPAPKQHHVDWLLLGIVIAVFLLALAIFWQTTLGAKTTTE
ncbi:MAG TPA: hypothetical protein VFN31_02875 [Candidatus Saccharimonadales bacterium]|nr:hypothetical protein [Candidatus Saccharimonadales bacterium]